MARMGRRIRWSSAALAAILIAGGLVALRSFVAKETGAPAAGDEAERTASQISEYLAFARANAQTPRDAAGTMRASTELQRHVKKFGSIDDMLKKHGHARVIVKYKGGAKDVGEPGLATRSWYWAWKQVGMPAAAPPQKLGSPRYVRRDVAPAEIEQLRKSGEVEGVFLDIPIPPALDQSGPLVRMDMAMLGSGPARPMRQTHAAVVLDSGVDDAHPFLAGAVLGDFAACFSTEQLREPFRSESLCPGGVGALEAVGAAKPCPAAIANCEHGTHVAGVLAGWRGEANGRKFHGVAPEVPIVPVQIYSKILSNEICTLSDLTTPCIMSFISDQVAALQYVEKLQGKGLPIGAVNLSLSFDLIADSCDEHQVARPVALAMKDLARLNIPVVVSAGNEGMLAAVGMPGCISDAVTVAATDKTGALAARYPGKSGGSNFSAMVDFAAPGVAILSAVPGNAFREMSGTSMAAPHVAAALASLRSLQPGAALADIIDGLKAQASTQARHPIETALARPIVRFDRSVRVAAGASAPAALPSSGGAVAPGGTGLAAPATARTLADVLGGRSGTRLMIDYGSADPEAVRRKIEDLLKAKGIAILQLDHKTERLGVLITEKPLDQGLLDALRSSANLKGLYLDVPVPPPGKQ